MAETQTCPKCGAELPNYAPSGICPKCLMQVGLESGEDIGSSSEIDPTMGRSGFVPPDVDQLAKHFPQLEILELLGKGGMGAVYKARQPGLDRFVAVKILPLEVGSDPAFAERFMREARALAKLSHPNIVSVFDFGQADGQYFFIMEYVDGANLRYVIETGAIKPEESLAIVPQICEALQFAHNEGVVHRDIKPENILLDKRGRVKIADFGLAKLLGKAASDRSLTGPHQAMGTLHYMAPEQMQGARSVDHRADIYSLGVVFYEMLTGQLPIGKFEPPSKKVEIDVRLDEIVLRSLESEPEKRYQHASDIRTDLDAVTIRSQDSPARSPSIAAGKTIPSILGIVHQAWDSWWTERGRWFTQGIQILLAAPTMICLLLFFGFSSQTEGPLTSNKTGPRKFPLETTHVTRIGIPSSPWFVCEASRGTALQYRIDFWSASFGVLILGFLPWYINWRIELAKASVTGKTLRWWHGSPKFYFAICGTGIVLCEIIVIYLD
jgi:serine/threonine protein kinase